MTLIEAARRLSQQAERLAFGSPVAFVYNPLAYARRSHEAYLLRYGEAPKRVVFLGMNPGPWGMAQTGVPFGEVEAVRDWLGIEAPVGRPAREHPKRTVEGFACRRSEVSGRRLWGLIRKRFGAPEAFFRDQFVANYCPLMFLDANGANLTPDRLPPADRLLLQEICDEHLRAVLTVLDPHWAIGIGKYAEKRLQRVQASLPERLRSRLRVAGIPHPSPANPGANRDWAGVAARELARLGVWP